jgi:eukaryotic-like serine/threonine-protein kinase
MSHEQAYRIKKSPRDGTWLNARYEILGLLARGGTSDVYLAREYQTGEHVIVKWLSEQANRDRQHRVRFLLGARATMAVNHPAIAQVLYVGELEVQPPYLVMQALKGESLAEYLERQETPDYAFVHMLMQDVASGLSAAHEAGIVHRDIKPGNLFLVGPIGEPTGVKILDFGLSKDLSEESYAPASRNLVLGTAQYMAPEQVLADPVDKRADIYAFGVVLFRVLTGQLPFDLDPSMELFGHQLFSPAPPLSWLNDDIDPRLEKLVLRCLQKDPDNRYASMHHLLEDLERISSSGPGLDWETMPTSFRAKPDFYRPRNPRGLEVAQTLADYLGVDEPTPTLPFVERLNFTECDDADLIPFSEAPLTTVAGER